MNQRYVLHVLLCSFVSCMPSYYTQFDYYQHISWGVSDRTVITVHTFKLAVIIVHIF